MDAFVDALDLRKLGYNRAPPARTRGVSQSRSDVAAEPTRTRSQGVADLRKDNGTAIKKVCARFVELRRRLLA
jgi:hypothetical protein